MGKEDERGRLLGCCWQETGGREKNSAYNSGTGRRQNIYTDKTRRANDGVAPPGIFFVLPRRAPFGFVPFRALLNRLVG